MLLYRTARRFESKPISTELITRIWAQDGWCYVPEKKIRQRWYENGKLLRMEQESWTGNIPKEEYCEQLTYYTLATHPLDWAEAGLLGFYERYTEAPTLG